MAIIDKYYRLNKNPFEKDDNYWTFKGSDKGMYVYPSTHNKESSDIGWSQLIPPEGKMKRGGIEYILDNFSTINIWECVQETKIDAIIGAINSVCDGYQSGKKAYEKAKESGALGKVGQFMAKALSTNSFFKALIDDSKLKFQNINKGALGEELDVSLKIVYALQFCLMNREVNNQYEFPYDSSQLYVSNGTDGWKHEESGFGGTSNYSLLGKLLNFMGSQIRIMSEPIWQGTSQDSQTQIQIKVNLFNNTIERAMTNYALIQNIMPNNLYLQYGILQQAPSYYDVHIIGNRRYPLCKANFTCNAKGIFRKFDMENLDIEDGYPKQIAKIIQDAHHELRIPDIYELEMNFQSLLPDSFNDFLYFWYLDEKDMAPITTIFKEGEPTNSVDTLIGYAPNATDTDLKSNCEKKTAELLGIKEEITPEAQAINNAVAQSFDEQQAKMNNAGKGNVDEEATYWTKFNDEFSDSSSQSTNQSQDSNVDVDDLFND